MRLFDSFAAFFRLSHLLRFAELVDHEIPLRLLDDVLDLFVLVTGRYDEPVALSMSLVVLVDGEVERLGAVVAAALADDLQLISRTVAQFLSCLLDFAIDGSVHCFVLRDTLVASVHVITPARQSFKPTTCMRRRAK